LKRANAATDWLTTWWDQHKPEDYDGPDIVGFRSKPGFIKYLEPGHFIPIVFISAWFAVLFIRVFIL